MSCRFPDIPMFYLLEGISLSRLHQKLRAEQVLQEGTMNDDMTHGQD